MARTLPMLLPVGTILYGFCGGHFGRDSYLDKRVEAVGADWLVVRNSAGDPEFVHLEPNDIGEGLLKWTEQEHDHPTTPTCKDGHENCCGDEPFIDVSAAEGNTLCYCPRIRDAHGRRIGCPQRVS